MMPYSLSWSLFCCLHSRSNCRTCCCGEQAFFSLSTLLPSTLRPGRLSSRRSRGTEDSCREASDWKTASSHKRTSATREQIVLMNHFKIFFEWSKLTPRTETHFCFVFVPDFVKICRFSSHHNFPSHTQVLNSF